MDLCCALEAEQYFLLSLFMFSWCCSKPSAVCAVFRGLVFVCYFCVAHVVSLYSGRNRSSFATFSVSRIFRLFVVICVFWAPISKHSLSAVIWLTFFFTHKKLSVWGFLLWAQCSLHNLRAVRNWTLAPSIVASVLFLKTKKLLFLILEPLQFSCCFVAVKIPFFIPGWTIRLHRLQVSHTDVHHCLRPGEGRREQ